MIYNNLIINKHVYEQLLLFYNKNHLPNAFIFHGNEGVGKEAHAIEFFALLNCHDPVNKTPYDIFLQLCRTYESFYAYPITSANQANLTAIDSPHILEKPCSPKPLRQTSFQN